MANESRMGILAHLEEIRRRMKWSLVAIIVTTSVSFAFAKYLFKILMLPAQGFKPVFTEMPEMFATYIKVSIVSGFVLVTPFLLYQLVMFVNPALTRGERRFLFSMLPVVFLFFAGGVAFGYFILLPPAIKFLLTFGSDIATPMIKIGNYINLVTMLLFWIGLSFELPAVLFFLAKLGVVSAEGLAKKRRFALIGAFILGAVITPTFDPVNQSLVAIPLIVLYELGIILSRFARRKRSNLH